MNVLIIEDDPTSMKLAMAILATQGVKTLGVESAEDALTAIKANQVEVILLDLVLPSMDGLTLANILKRDPETCHIPIIATTSFPERFPQKAALQAGCDGYFVKPLDTRALPNHVTRAFTDSKGESEQIASHLPDIKPKNANEHPDR